MVEIQMIALIPTVDLSVPHDGRNLPGKLNATPCGSRCEPQRAQLIYQVAGIVGS
jgi:hypothetical protein